MEPMDKVSTRNKLTYAVPSIGRDMMYALYATYLMVFLTDALGLSDWELVAVGVVIAIARVWDAVNDPMMGVIIDNTETRHGKFKPWILSGALLSGIFMFMLFQDYGLTGWGFITLFAVLYVFSGMTFTMNDISYWSMYPTFSTNQKERESIGALARIFASLGMFIVIAAVPIIYQNFPGGPKQGFFWIVLVTALIFIISQVVVFFGVKEKKSLITDVKQAKTRLSDMVSIIFKNDQLVVIIIAILLFNTGYFITTSLGIYFFSYDLNLYGGIEFTLFSGILAVSQLSALALFPFLAKKMTRKKIFTIAVIMIAVGYTLFMSVGYVFPDSVSMLVVGLAGLVLFSGQGFIQVLTLVMLADTIEYGQWKIGTRNESVVFAINPFVTKLASAFQAAIVAMTLAFSGLNSKVINPVTRAKEADPGLSNDAVREMIASLVEEPMLLALRLSMIIVPLILIIISYIVYRKSYKIDTAFYDRITKDLEERMTGQAGA
jgi:melibiose permease